MAGCDGSGKWKPDGVQDWVQPPDPRIAADCLRVNGVSMILLVNLKGRTMVCKKK